MFKELFERYGYTVEEFGKGFIADNGVFCIPFSQFSCRSYEFMSGVSFLSEDKETIKKSYSSQEKQIGFAVFSDWMNDCLECQPFGRLGNHDLSLGEVECWLKKLKSGYQFST